MQCNRVVRLLGSIAFTAALHGIPCVGAADEVPYHQSAPPNAAFTPDQAIAAAQLPPGFKMECVAHEPDLINPTAFTFDDQGRIWVTESFEYPRADAGLGRDCVKILESTNHDGKFDKVTTFVENLNIPCGVTIGNGGVYVTNSPDILFYPDAAITAKVSKPEVILSGFGRFDRHELPNSLTWGPDGWLYGMNGVFNPAVVTNNGTTFNFTCAIWRWHPQSRNLELFAQGTSNPWGLDYNRQGDWFVSCCVIDHLFHMTQSGYYTRQGGPYPPATRALPSITTARHQAAAYAGLCIYDADVFPEDYRGTLIMGNLHGSALNHDILQRNGATYTQSSAPDFLQANDKWFMPVSQKIGPDGCLYVMDWYDRYHCYQDAGRDPAGVDRERGRIYRISYNNAPFYKPFDLQKDSTEELLKLLDSPNIWWRRTAQRILNEKFAPEMIPALEKMALDPSGRNNANMHALWLLTSQHALSPAFHLKVLASEDEPTRNWGVRAAGEMGQVSVEVYDKLKLLAIDPSPDVRCQLAVAAGRLHTPDGVPLLVELLHNSANASDPLIPNIIYSNLTPLLKSRGAEIVQLLDNDSAAKVSFGESVISWLHQAYNTLARTPAQIADSAKAVLFDAKATPKIAATLGDVIDGFENSGVKPPDRAQYFDQPTRDRLASLSARSDDPASMPATVISLWWNDATAATHARQIVSDASANVATRSMLMKALAGEKSAENLPSFSAFLRDNAAPVRLRLIAANALGTMDDPAAATALVDTYPTAEPADLKPIIIDALSQSKAGAAALLAAVADKKIPVGQVTENHARKIAGYNDPDLSKQLASTFGTIRNDRNPERAAVAEKYKKIVLSHPAGNPLAGQKVFSAKCMQCHTIYGKGGEVGPDLTGVGRDNLDLVLSNVLDPNLVVGKPYYQWIVKLKNGNSQSGILAEESDKQLVLKDGTQRITIPRQDIAKMKETSLSMMPEGLENTMSEPEFIDLVAFLLSRRAPAPWDAVK
jgi:putative membrane-bound dehydrogenase-like protein